jgi:hypothetical protein
VDDREAAVTDPYWEEVARLLPDADLVLLPPDDPAQPSDDSRLIGAVRARQVRDEAHRILRITWQELLPDVPTPQLVRRVWRAARPDAALVQVELVARRPGVAEPRPVLSAARARLLTAGRVVDERRWADSAGLRLVTDVDGHRAELFGVPDPAALTLALLTPPTPVPVELGRELVAAAVEELPY